MEPLLIAHQFWQWHPRAGLILLAQSWLMRIVIRQPERMFWLVLRTTVILRAGHAYFHLPHERDGLRHVHRCHGVADPPQPLRG